MLLQQRTVDGVTYVNDSIATAPERVIAALRSYDEPIILLAGGDKRTQARDIKSALHMARNLLE